MTECRQATFEFQGIKGKRVEGKFDGGDADYKASPDQNSRDGYGNCSSGLLLYGFRVSAKRAFYQISEKRHRLE